MNSFEIKSKCYLFNPTKYYHPREDPCQIHFNYPLYSSCHRCLLHLKYLIDQEHSKDKKKLKKNVKLLQRKLDPIRSEVIIRRYRHRL